MSPPALLESVMGTEMARMPGRIIAETPSGPLAATVRLEMRASPALIG